MRKITAVISLFVTISVIVGCSSIDCSLNSLVRTHYSFLTPYNTPDTLLDTLTISTPKPGGDTILLNRATEITEFTLPVSYSLDRDTLYFTFHMRDGRIITDMVVMKKTNESHFESVDCPPTFFHKVEELQHEGSAIDSLRVNDIHINNGTENKNIFIYRNAFI